MKPAFSPILMKAILTSALTCSLYSETLQIASCTTLPYVGVLARALTEVPPTRIATRAKAAAYSSVAAPRLPWRARRWSRANMAGGILNGRGFALRLSGAGTRGHGPAGPTADPEAHSAALVVRRLNVLDRGGGVGS